MRELDHFIDWSKKYSSNSEDYILRMLLPYATGSYIETGAWHPTEGSNSYVFYERGWRGLLIEPHPAWARRVMSGRPEDVVINCGAGDTEGEMILNLAGQASSLRTEWSMTPTSELKVKIRRLDDILKDHPQFNKPDFFSLDVEGYELEALNGVDWSLFRPTVICIEAVEWNPFQRVHDKWEHILLNHGYKLICHNLQNRFYGVEEDEQVWKQVEKYKLAE